MQIAEIARVIQLSVAPVFLLTGVSALLGVLSTRLGRTIDRARALEATESGHVLQDLAVLSRRAKLIYRAILLATTCALLVCFVIAALFAAIGIAAPRPDADEELLFERVFHGSSRGPIRSTRVAKNTSRRKWRRDVMRAAMAATNRTATTALTGKRTNALMKSAAMTKQTNSAQVVARRMAR